MEQTVTCPNCGYTFRIAKETFDKYREGISLNKKHEVTDGDAILLDCAGCNRVIKISIRTWNVVGEGPAEHTRGYEWVGGADRPRLAGDEYAIAEGATAPERSDPSSVLIRLTEYGRVEKPLPDAGLGVMLGILLLCALPLALLLAEPAVAAMAAARGYTVAVVPEEQPPEPAPVPETEPAAPAAAAEQRPAGKPAAEPDEPRLLTPVKEPTLLRDSRFERVLRKYNKQIKDVEKQADPAPTAK